MLGILGGPALGLDYGPASYAMREAGPTGYASAVSREPGWGAAEPAAWDTAGLAVYYSPPGAVAPYATSVPRLTERAADPHVGGYAEPAAAGADAGWRAYAYSEPVVAEPAGEAQYELAYEPVQEAAYRPEPAAPQAFDPFSAPLADVQQYVAGVEAERDAQRAWYAGSASGPEHETSPLYDGLAVEVARDLQACGRNALEDMGSLVTHRVAAILADDVPVQPEAGPVQADLTISSPFDDETLAASPIFADIGSSLGWGAFQDVSSFQGQAEQQSAEQRMPEPVSVLSAVRTPGGFYAEIDPRDPLATTGPLPRIPQPRRPLDTDGWPPYTSYHGLAAVAA